MNKISLIIWVVILFVINDAQSQVYSWKNLNNSPFDTSRHEDCFFINGQTGWIVNYGGFTSKTTNGGASWVQQFSANALFRSVSFINPNTGWIGCVDTSGLYSTTNGGANWSKVNMGFSLANVGICGMYSVNQNVIYGCGRYYSPARIIKTTNGGQNWSLINMDTYASTLIDCYFIDENTGFVVGGKGIFPTTIKPVVLKTTNGGTTFQQMYLGSRTAEWCWKISFPSPDTGYVSVERETGGTTIFLKTTNGGTNWTEKSFVNGYDEEGIGFINNTTGWIGGWGGPTYATTNGGDSWQLAGWGTNVNRFRFFKDTLAYAVGQRMYVYSKDPVGINSITGKIPDKFKLYQNYPNPFNPETRIKFELPERSTVKISVYDMLGKETAVLANQNMEAGIYEAAFNAAELPGGVYFYKMESSKFTAVKKLILIK